MSPTGRWQRIWACPIPSRKRPSLVYRAGKTRGGAGLQPLRPKRIIWSFYLPPDRLIVETYLLILVSTVFVNNIVLVKILGLCPFMGVSKKLEPAIGMGLATTFVLTLASGASYLINEYLLGSELFYLRTLSFIVVIAAVVQFTEMFLHKMFPLLYQVLGIYLPLITTNCAVLGIPLLNVQARHDFVESLFFGLGGALGFSMILIVFAAMRERLEGADVPAPFRGTAIAMVTAGFMSLAFMGFSGLVK
ncbi:MAG: electron transport complex subunit RsxA [Burkholderiales bacterium]|nr:electron transport complex subunit RsxA [Burkholderiales bacterium]